MGCPHAHGEAYTELVEPALIATSAAPQGRGFDDSVHNIETSSQVRAMPGL